jgi:SH3-like domain-containing protein
MEEEVVNFCRVKELQPGDVFLMNGNWRRVTDIVGGRIWFKYLYHISHDTGNSNSVGANSSQYVQLVKPK